MDTLTSFCWFVLRLRRLKYHVAESVWILEDQLLLPYHLDRTSRTKALEIAAILVWSSHVFHGAGCEFFHFVQLRGTNVKLEWSAGFGRLSINVDNSWYSINPPMLKFHVVSDIIWHRRTWKPMQLQVCMYLSDKSLQPKGLFIRLFGTSADSLLR